ncbi:MAG: MBOAT family protein [Clostridia bacterium]|nr:MBOAT family protein [Clostridia bacterium]
MVFSDLFFLFFFLPLQLLICSFIDTTKKRNVVLLIFSLIFYAWGEPVYILLLIGMTFINWFFSLLIDVCPDKAKAKKFLIINVALSLLLIGIFKYTGFFAENLKTLFSLDIITPKIPLPIGISFYTFQLISYTVDVYRGEAKCATKFHELLLYASLFYQCIAGPIVRYSDVQLEIQSRKRSFTSMGKGVQRFSVGLAKKTLLANSCGKLVDMILLSDAELADLSSLSDNIEILSSRPAAMLWLGMIFYTLQIYLDFSAYSDMAIGMGLMEGFHFKENFRYPYTAVSVTDFWRRWHISLSSFFRDYVYIPLGGNRKGTVRTILNLLVVWLLTGFWHGASWNFILWGLYYFIFLVAEKLFLSKILKKLPNFITNLYTLTVVFFGWLLFRFSETSVLFTVFKGMFCMNGNSMFSAETTAVFTSNLFFLVIAILAVTPLMTNLRRLLSNRAKYNKKLLKAKCVIYAAVPAVLIILSVFSVVGNSYNPFLYFQF